MKQFMDAVMPNPRGKCKSITVSLVPRGKNFSKSFLDKIYNCNDSELRNTIYCPVVGGSNLFTNAPIATICSAGQYDVDLGAALDCQTCPAGYYCVGGTATKQQCGVNTYCPSGSTNQISCPINSTSFAGSTKITDCQCDAGFAVSGNSASFICVQQNCPAGQYDSDAGSVMSRT